MIGQRALLGLLVAGWLADALASKDADVEAGIEAYEVGHLQEALDRFAAAQERLGERAEIHFDRGLALLGRGEEEEARQAFLHASEAEDASIRSSAHYQLGNMAFEKEDWDGAITSYVESLKAWPDHTNAKWNLELALKRKAEEEKEQEKEQETDGTGGDEGTGGTGESGGEESGPGSEGTGEEGETGSEEQDQGKTGDEDRQTGQDSPERADEKQEEAAAEPMDKLDIQKALEQLDAEDDYQLGKPFGRVPVPEKDW